MKPGDLKELSSGKILAVFTVSSMPLIHLILQWMVEYHLPTCIEYFCADEAYEHFTIFPRAFLI